MLKKRKLTKSYSQNHVKINNRSIEREKSHWKKINTQCKIHMCEQNRTKKTNAKQIPVTVFPINIKTIKHCKSYFKNRTK